MADGDGRRAADLARERGHTALADELLGKPAAAAAAPAAPAAPEGEPSGWSAGQLKRYLAAHAIDHAGCFEKGELLDLVLAHRGEAPPPADPTPPPSPAAANGHANGRANGHANGHGYANGFAEEAAAAEEEEPTTLGELAAHELKSALALLGGLDGGRAQPPLSKAEARSAARLRAVLRAELGSRDDVLL